MTKRQLARLRKIVAMAQELLRQGEANPTLPATARRGGASGRTRRTAADAVKMRADVLAKRKKGVPAAELAEKYGVSTAYIYMIKK